MPESGLVSVNAVEKCNIFQHTNSCSKAQVLACLMRSAPNWHAVKIIHTGYNQVERVNILCCSFVILSDGPMVQTFSPPETVVLIRLHTFGGLDPQL